MRKILTYGLSWHIDKISADKMGKTPLYKNCFDSIYNGIQSKILMFYYLSEYYR